MKNWTIEYLVCRPN